MFDIAKRRGSGNSPMRPNIKNEYALAIIWTEAALGRGEQAIMSQRKNEIYTEPIRGTIKYS